MWQICHDHDSHEGSCIYILPHSNPGVRIHVQQPAIDDLLLLIRELRIEIPMVWFTFWWEGDDMQIGTLWLIGDGANEWRE